MTKFERGSAKKQAVPKRDEKPIHGLVSDKNFIVANAVENILAGKYHFNIFLFWRVGSHHLTSMEQSWQLLFSDLNLRGGPGYITFYHCLLLLLSKVIGSYSGQKRQTFVAICFASQQALDLILASQFEF